MTLSKLILLAGGLTDSATTREIEITRLDTVNETVYADKFNVELPQNYWEVDPKDDFVLNDYDRVLVKFDPYKTFSGVVTVTGEVKFPGRYKILYNGERATDFIKRAGGLKTNAYTKGMYILRGNPLLRFGNISTNELPDTIKYTDINDLLYNRNELISQFSNRIPLNWDEITADTNSTYNIELQANDQLVISKDNNLVYVVGSVGLPTSVPYKEGAGLELLCRPGGRLYG